MNKAKLVWGIKIRVCFIQEESQRRIGGGAITFWILCKELVRRGHHVCIISNKLVESLSQMYPKEVEIKEVIESKGEPVQLSSMLDRLIQILKSRGAVYKAVEDFSPDILCFGGEYAGVLALLTKLKYKIPVIFFKFQSTFETWRELAPFPKGYAISFLEKTFLRLPFDAIMGSEYVYTVFKNMKLKLTSGDKFFKAVPGVDSDLFLYRNDGGKLKEKMGLKNKKIVLYVGALSKVKGVEYLIKTMKILNKRNGNYHLLTVGEGEERENLERLVKNLKLGNSVTFVGERPYLEIPNFILASDVVVAPSLSELFGTRVMFDAWALKRPVIATKVGDVPKIARDNRTALLIPPKDPKAMAEKIEKILSDKKMKKKIVKDAYEEAKKYSSERLVEIFIKACKEVIKTRKMI